MRLRIVTLRYSDGLQGFPEDAVAKAVAGHEILEVREHFFVHGNVPHLTLVLSLGEGPGGGKYSGVQREDPGEKLPEDLRPLYKQLRQWRDDRAKTEGIPSGPSPLSIVGEATCEKYGKDLLSCGPAPAARCIPARDEIPGIAISKPTSPEGTK